MSLLALLALTFLAAKPTPSLKAAARQGPVPLHVIDGGVTPPLRDMARGAWMARGTARARRENTLPLFSGLSPAPALRLDFPGLGAGDYGFVPSQLPPDANGAVGATQYMQGVNEAFAVFDKTTGALVFGPASSDIFWTLLGSDCTNNGRGAPLFRYDRAADRWIVLQSASATNPFPGPLLCIAISRTPDATGPYRSVAYGFFSQDLTWVPASLGVWPDAYYLTLFQFQTTPTPSGALACALDRAALLGTALPAAQCQSMGSGVPQILPSDLDGANPPPVGSPNYLLALGTDSLNLWKFGPLVGGFAPLVGPTSLPVTPFVTACGGGGSCIPQPGTPQTLDSVGDRLMPRLAYRNFGTHESLVVNHSVDVGGGVTGIRWYELRSPGTTPTVFQEGTHVPTSDHRWMGSIAMDRQGNMALGYSVSSGSLFPSIRYAGRGVSDAPGLLGAEASLVEGAGSQLADSRWGSLSSLSLDPTDDCTFFYTSEYLKSTGSLNWSTRVFTLRFPSCGAADFHTVTPCRLADTRGAAGPSGGPALTAGATRSFPITGLCAIPPDATAVSVNVTAAQAAASGYLTLFPGDAPQAPFASTLNFSVGQTRGNNAIVALPLGGGGTIQVRNGSTGTVHLVLDVSGYFK